jgi:hypothetical protein
VYQNSARSDQARARRVAWASCVEPGPGYPSPFPLAPRSTEVRRGGSPRSRSDLATSGQEGNQRAQRFCGGPRPHQVAGSQCDRDRVGERSGRVLARFSDRHRVLRCGPEPGMRRAVRQPNLAVDGRVVDSWRAARDAAAGCAEVRLRET